MKRKLFGIFLSLALVLSMMPMGLIAAQAAEDSYNLWLGDVQVTSENMNSIPGVTGGTASYDPVNHVLTMTNVTAINGVHTISSYESAKIYSVGDLTIKGSCKIDASQTTYGIRANGNLTLDADLEVNDAESLGVSVEGAKNIIINSGKINISSDTSLYGLIGGTGSTLTIKDGDITIKSYGHDEYGNGNRVIISAQVGFYPKGMIGYFCDFIHVFCNFSQKQELNGEVAESTQLFPQFIECKNPQFASLVKIVESSPLYKLTAEVASCRFAIAAPLFLFLQYQETLFGLFQKQSYLQPQVLCHCHEMERGAPPYHHLNQMVCWVV